MMHLRKGMRALMHEEEEGCEEAWFEAQEQGWLIRAEAQEQCWLIRVEREFLKPRLLS
jgi:hypothetical protein